jgi:hypothetical protein
MRHSRRQGTVLATADGITIYLIGLASISTIIILVVMGCPHDTRRLVYAAV